MFYKFFDRNAHIGVVLALLIQLLFVPPGTVPADSKVTTAGCINFEPVTFFSDDFQDGQADGWSFSDAAGQPLPSPWPVEDDGFFMGL